MAIKFVCKDCKFEFKPRNPERINPPNICPYCGKTGGVTTKKHLLEEIF